MLKELIYPFAERDVRALKAGDAVSITGRIYTGRDKFHKYFADGGKLPVDFRDGALYHSGPVVVTSKPQTSNFKPQTSNIKPQTSNLKPQTSNLKPQTSNLKLQTLTTYIVRAAGPTTSVRENPYEPDFIARTGVRIIIGKGGMDAKTLAAMKKHGCVYVQAVGGGGAIYADAVRNVAGVSLLEEFGAAEAVWHFDVVGFRGVVAMDAHGHSLFDRVVALSKEKLEEMTR